jgi:hypothetical protein
LFILPYAVCRQPQRHNLWLSVWEGLGDFDRTKGHLWDDGAARFLRQSALEVPERPGDHFVTSTAERLFRDSVVSDIRSDPGWYLAILGHRLLATVTQVQLWSGGLEGQSIYKSFYPNEGRKKYRSLTAAVDRIGVGPWRAYLPLWVIASPTPILLMACCRADLRPRLKGPLLIMGIVALGSLAVPLLISTAGGIETQAFALAYLLGWGFFLEVLPPLLRKRDPPESPRSASVSQLQTRAPLGGPPALG